VVFRVPRFTLDEGSLMLFSINIQLVHRHHNL